MLLAYKRWNRFDPAASVNPKRILLLHGMGGTGNLWRPLAAGLEDRFDVVAPDQRGHGESQVPHVPGSRVQEGYTPLDYGRDLVDTLEELKFHPCWVLGHSMGVRSACALAHLRPDWVQGLILIDLGFQGVAGGGLGGGLASFLRKLPKRFASRADARAFLAAECPDPSIAQYLMAVLMPLPDRSVEFPFDHGALIQTIEAARDVSVRTWVEDLGGRAKPILVLRGGSSRVWSREEFEAERARFAAYPSIRFLEVPGAGHGLPFEKRAELLSLLEEFTSKT